MNIKTITCHDVYNYGASLQAYALQTFLLENGHNVEIIDYLPKYKKFYQVFKANSSGFLGKVYKKIPFMEPLCAIVQHISWIRFVPQIIRFKQFKRNHLICTNCTYSSIEDFDANKVEADIFIAGSDQIWNTAFQNGLDPVYYCLFEPERSKCISYAASFGISSIPKEHEEFVTNALSHFRKLSVRENSGVKIIESLGYTAENVLDPVFLLTKEQWSKILKSRHIREKYILLYDFSNGDKRLELLAKKIAKERSLKIFSLNTKRDYIDKVFCECGPIEFIEMIIGADIIISNSFHATAFSVIFEKDFYTLPLLGHGNSSRMKDLLKKIRLSDRYVENVETVEVNSHVDFSEVSKLLAVEIDKSQQWLLDNISITGKYKR